MITTPLTADFVLGAAELEATSGGLRPHRLPATMRERSADPQLRLMEAQPSGVRVALTTTAQKVTLQLHTTRVAYKGMRRARGAVDVVVDRTNVDSHVLEQGDFLELDMVTGASTLEAGDPDHVVVENLPAGDKAVEFWLPHNEQVDLVSIESDQPIRPLIDDAPVWVHHGSSISHGSNAASPTGIWPVVAAREAGVQLRNLGFGGSALVDPFMARLIKDTPADLISLKLGINVVNLDAMRLRSFVPAVHGFLDTVRDGHPDTPLLLISPVCCPIHENTPGPGSVDTATLGTDTVKFTATGTAGDTTGGRLTLQVIRQALNDLVTARSDDPNLHYLDGMHLYGQADAQAHPLPDNLHPDTATHGLIGRRFVDLAFHAPGAFASVTALKTPTGPI